MLQRAINSFIPRAQCGELVYRLFCLIHLSSVRSLAEGCLEDMSTSIYCQKLRSNCKYVLYGHTYPLDISLVQTTQVKLNIISKTMIMDVTSSTNEKIIVSLLLTKKFHVVLPQELFSTFLLARPHLAYNHWHKKENELPKPFQISPPSSAEKNGLEKFRRQYAICNGLTNP